MVAGKTNAGLLAAVGIIAVLPLLGGCVHKFTGAKENFQTSVLEQTSNARIAYITMKGSSIAGDPESGGTGSATITADGSHASMTPDFDAIDPQTGLPIAPQPPDFYGGPASSIMVERQVGLNDENDTFLTYHETHDGDETMYARGYTGTRTDANYITNQRNAADRSATYNGTGFVNVGQGNGAYEIDGDLAMTVDFSDPDGVSALSGSITDSAITSPTTENPDAVNRVEFLGDLLDDSADYAIHNITLHDGSGGQIAYVDEGGGTGSFFGSHAQGTMGVFSGTGSTSADAKAGLYGERVNVIGSFAGKQPPLP